jgi:hypothetical protein
MQKFCIKQIFYYICGMDDELDKFIHNAKQLGLCSEYSAKVDKAASKKQMLDIALDSNGISYIAESVAKGWGLTVDYIYSTFAPFINGRYIHHGNAYTTTLYCKSDNVTVSSTAALILECNGEIHSDRICELHIANSNVKITGNGKCVVYLYNSTISNPDSFKGIIKEDNHYE